jgi:hypothetical protein
METRNVQLSLEMAKKWFEGDNTELKDLAVKTYPELEKKQLPKTWEELKTIDGYSVSIFSKIKSFQKTDCVESGKNTFATKKQAEASIAMAQLSQLMKVYKDGWVADYKNNSNNYCIFFFEDEVKIDLFVHGQCFLSFKNKETAQLFLENFRDLIEQAKPLL